MGGVGRVVETYDLQRATKFDASDVRADEVSARVELRTNVMIRSNFRFGRMLAVAEGLS